MKRYLSRLWPNAWRRTITVDVESLITLSLVMMYVSTAATWVSARAAVALAEGRDLEIQLTHSSVHGVHMRVIPVADSMTAIVLEFTSNKGLMLELLRLTLVERRTPRPGDRLGRTPAGKLTVEYDCMTGEYAFVEFVPSAND